MNRKGAAWVMQFLVVFILLMVAYLVINQMFSRVAEASGKQFSEFEQRERARSCKAAGALYGGVDDDFGRDQGDGYSDSCDLCLGGDDRVDRVPSPGGDGIPDACEPVGFRPEKGMKMSDICNRAQRCTSKKCWDEITEQCVLTCYNEGGCPR